MRHHRYVLGLACALTAWAPLGCGTQVSADFLRPAQDEVLEVVGTILTPDYPWKVAVKGQYAYTADMYGRDANGNWAAYMRVIDISDPTNPTVAAEYLSIYREVMDVFVKDNLAFLAADFGNNASGTRGGIEIVDITDPLNPTYVGHHDGINYDGPWSIVAAGDYAYAQDSHAFLVFDISDPAAPQFVTQIGDLPSQNWDVAVFGDYVYLSGDDGVRIIDVTDPTQPWVVSIIPTLGAWATDVSGNYAYVGHGRDFSVVRIAQASNPRIVSTLRFISGIEDVVVVGDYALLAAQSMLEVVDISNPNNPTVVDSVAATPTGIAVVGPYAVLSSGSWGVEVVDVSDYVAMGAFEQHQFAYVDAQGAMLDPPGEETTLDGVQTGDNLRMRLAFTDSGASAQNALVRVKYYTSLQDFQDDTNGGYVADAGQGAEWSWWDGCASGSWCDHGTALTQAVTSDHSPEPGFAFESDYAGFSWTPPTSNSACENNLNLTYTGVRSEPTEWWFRYEINGTPISYSGMHYNGNKGAFLRTVPATP